VELMVQPLFGDKPSINGALPLLIELRNRGGNVQGRVSVLLDTYYYSREYVYPIELPAGARKQLIACPILGQYSANVLVRFQGGGSQVEMRVQITPVSESDNLVVGVGDAIGGLQFLRTLNTRPRPQLYRRYYSSTPQMQQGGTYEVAYCRPELFPPSALACSGVSVMVLGAGAERMNSEQWRALLNWVKLGGSLIVPGGAGALYLQNAALRSVLPVQVQGLQALPSLKAVGTFAGQPPPQGSASITRSRPRPEGEVLLQQDGIPLIVRRAYGLGAILFLAFSPWDQPMRGYAGNGAFWLSLLRNAPDLPPSYLMLSLYESHTGASGGLSFGPGAVPMSFPTRFQVRMPAAELVIGLLLAYFVLVVPVNYFVLRRLRALDWAWLTVPLIAVLFVLVLARLAGDLYRKPLSGDIQTALILPPGERDAYAVNSVMFFFPKAGLYDLQFEGSEMVEAGQSDQSFVTGGMRVELSTIEGEPKRVEDYRVRSLSLQWFRYTRTVSLQGTIEANLRLRRQGTMLEITGTLRNKLPYDLRNVTLREGGQTLVFEKLPSGREQKVSWKLSLYDVLGYEPEPASEMGPLSFEQVVYHLSHPWRAEPSFVLLTALADQPVLAPELERSPEYSAQVSYLVPIPLRGEP
jgi:hypothetical protein